MKIKCLSCGQFDHKLINCPLIHEKFTPNIIIKHLRMSKNNRRLINRKGKKINAFKTKQRILENELRVRLGKKKNTPLLKRMNGRKTMSLEDINSNIGEKFVKFN